MHVHTGYSCLLGQYHKCCKLLAKTYVYLESKGCVVANLSMLYYNIVTNSN